MCEKLGLFHQPRQPALLRIHVLLVQCPVSAGHERTRIEMTAVGHVCGCEVDEFGADVQHGSRGDATDARIMRSFY